MTHCGELRLLIGPTPILRVDVEAQTVRLIAREDATRLVAHGGQRPIWMLDLAACLVAFARAAGTDDRIFDLDEIGAVSGMDPGTVHYYTRAGVLTPSIRPSDGPGRGKSRLYSWRDAFSAAVVGSLRRQRVPIDMLRRVADLLRAPAPPAVCSVEDESVADLEHHR